VDYTQIMAWTTWLDTDGNIRVRIEGYLDKVEGQQAMQSVVGLLGPQPRDLVFEASAMLGYRRGVRSACQAALLEHRASVRSIALVGGNSVVRMGSSVIAMSLGVPLVVHEAEQVAEPDAPVRRARPRTGSRPRSRPMSRAMLAADETPARRERSRGIRHGREGSRPNQ
jgi:hypothetical protein